MYIKKDSINIARPLIRNVPNIVVLSSRPEHERKIQLCQHVLDVLTRVDPGFTKWRGTVLQVHCELHNGQTKRNVSRV